MPELQKILDSLITHKYGNYVLQSLVRMSQKIRSTTQSLCRTRISTYSTNEYASRVMQVLVADDKEFRNWVLAWARGQESRLAECPASGLLLAAAVKNCLSGQNYESIVSAVVRNPWKWSSTKYHKRIMTSLFQVASTKTLDTLFRALNLDFEIAGQFEEKYSAFAFYTLLLREYSPALVALENTIETSSAELFGSRYFRHTLNSLATAPAAKFIFPRLSNVIADNLSTIMQRAPSGSPSYFLNAYLVLLVSGPREFSWVSDFWIKLEQSLPTVTE